MKTAFFRCIASDMASLLLNVLQEQGVLCLVQFLEVFGTHLLRSRCEELFLVVAPGEEITQRVLVHDWFQHARPPCGIGNVLISAFSQGEEFSVAHREGADKVKVARALPDKVLFRSPLIGIFANQRHTVVAGITLQETLLRPASVEVRRVAPQQVGQSLACQIVLQEVPKCMVFFVST